MLPSRMVLVALMLGGLACGGKREERADPGDPASSTAALVSAAASASAAAIPSPTASAALSASAVVSASPAPAAAPGCPEDMVLVAGAYCPDVEQTCIRHHAEFERDQRKKKKQKASGEGGERSTVSERCLEYAAPSKCLSKEKKPLRFCVDRYEFPNKKGELPDLLISWTEAKKKCEALGKRLCTVEEFNFACEGEAMLPYTYGFVRDAQKCSIDKEYRKREKKLFPYEKCMKKPACKEHLAKLDQRLPAGSQPECVSPFGVYDMNGNINEWVEIPGKKYPDRSGLKGGWWGPVRGRCRPTVDFHHEDDYGYEEGFRCCANAL